MNVYILSEEFDHELSVNLGVYSSEDDAYSVACAMLKGNVDERSVRISEYALDADPTPLGRSVELWHLTHGYAMAMARHILEEGYEERPGLTPGFVLLRKEEVKS